MGSLSDFVKSVADAPKSGSLSDFVQQAAAAQPAPAPVAAVQPRPAAVEQPSWIERQLAKLPSSWADANAKGSVIGGIVHGAADPSVGAAQIIANLPLIRDIPLGATTLSDLVTGKSHALGDVVNKGIAEQAKSYEDKRAAQGRSGIDAARVVGNIASPVNLLGARFLPVNPSASLLTQAGQGALAGGLGGALQPVDDAGDTGSFWGPKLGQIGAGSVAGGIATPILGKLTGAIASKVQSMKAASNVSPGSIDTAITGALKETGIKPNELPAGYLDEIKGQVLSSLKTGKPIDAAAALRAKDFASLDVPPTQGSLTRDATQFALERNLRAVPGAGAPLMNTFTEQNRKLADALRSFGGANAKEAYGAGDQLVNSLSATDKGMQSNVSSLYTAARNSSGKDLDVPLNGLAQDYADVVDRFADKIPAGVRAQFGKLGLDPANPSNQLKTFTIEDSDKLLKVINDHVGTDPATNKALTELRNSVKGAVSSADATGGPFAPAVAAAAERFKLQDAIPALAKAAEGGANKDKFVDQFIINGQTDQVKKLADLLKKTDPAAYDQAREQIGARLQRAAFGENLSGDKLIAPERFAKAIRDMGSEKLSAFYSADEINKMRTAARVAAYVNSTPNAAPVLGNPNMFWAGRLTSAAEKAPVLGPMISMGKAASKAGEAARNVSAAIDPSIPIVSAGLTPDEKSILAKILAGGLVAGGGLASSIPRRLPTQKE